MLARSAVLFLLLVRIAQADAIDYRVHYAATTPELVTVALRPAAPLIAPLPLIMPRTYPGGYAQIPYDDFVSQVVAKGADGKLLAVVRDPDGPRWMLGQAGDAVASVEYTVDIARMEGAVQDAVATSKHRSGYLALLGYSIFAYLEGGEDRPIHLQIDAPPGWPVLSTLAPKLPSPLGASAATALDFYELADSQILMGPDFKVTKLDGAIPLFMAIYSEGEVDAVLEGHLAREALDRVQSYFGDTPIPQYTVQLELLRPQPAHHYGFSQEHIESGTFSLSLDAALTARSPARDLERLQFNYAHHMAHSWIPKRAYGVGYRPFSWEMAPVIDTIWFNEGFGRYAAIQAMASGMAPEQGQAFRDSQLRTLKHVIDAAPPFIRRMPLDVLSREASFLYSADFRTGRNVFARGALMAAEMDDRIQAQTQGKKSLRDALRWLLGWSAQHPGPFATKDLAGYFATATGVDVADILAHWQRPLDSP